MLIQNLSIVISTIFFCVICVHGYRDGAREESCYNHTVDHEGDVFFGNCVPSSCRYFLVIKKVVDETTLELGNEIDTYECGKIYGIEVANDLNAPEGFLVQARNGTSDSSEIIGTFLHPDDVKNRTGATRVNYKILQCRRSEAENSTSPLLNNSATQPDTVNMAGTLQLYWQAPDCNNDSCTEEYDYPNVTVWFTIVQQLLLVFNPSKTTVLTYKPPPPVPMPASCIMAMPSTSMVTSVAPTSELSPPSVSSAATAEGMAVSSAAAFTTEGMAGTLPQQTTTPTPSVEGSSDGLSQGAIIGIGAGGGIVAVILVVLIIIVIVAVIRHVYLSTKKKSKPSRVSMLWATSPELPTDSNGKNVYELSPSDPFALNGTNENGSKTNDICIENDVYEKSDPEKIDKD